MPDEQNTSPQTPTSTSSPDNDVSSSVPAVEKEPASAGSMSSQNSDERSPVPSMGSAKSPAKKSRKKLVIWASVVGVFALLLGGGALAYTMYQSPDKVLVDSVVNLVKAKTGVVKGTLLMKTSDLEFNLTFDTKDAADTSRSVAMQLSLKSDRFATDKIDVKAESVTDKDGNLYFKVSNLKEATEAALDAYMDMSMQPGLGAMQQTDDAQMKAAKADLEKQLQPIVAKVDNKWLKVSASDLDKFSGKSNTQECIKNTVEKLQNDSKFSNELVDMYYKNKFVVVKEQLGVKDGNVGYVLDIDKDKAEAFGKAAESSQFAKDLKGCSQDTSRPSAPQVQRPNEEQVDVTTRVEVWVSQWSHELKQVKVMVDDKKRSMTMSLDMTSDMSVNPEIQIPSDAQPFSEVMTELQQLMMGPMANPSEAQGGSSQEEGLRGIIIQQYKANNQGKTPSEAEIKKMLELYGAVNNS